MKVDLREREISQKKRREKKNEIISLENLRERKKISPFIIFLPPTPCGS
jgi:hypothetical protein